jgi:hypothetical protein
VTSRARGILRDGTGALVGRVEVTSEADLYVGTIDGVSPDAIALFEHYEAMVNDQLLAHVDELERQIAELGVVFVATGLAPQPVHDVQIYPRAGTVSFRVRRARDLAEGTT